ncbi:restriction endonuclease subunit S [Saccharibacter floricola]|uniref:Type I restriction-modification system S subunit n=1 Tax=Saccharibacter floricola DSM 15669 TaxID=1123227 RepID=A0ABQ0P0Y1_9PROT|nr:restriction endonuclease subunit S [Saccharibacter floricola]GBQ08539.1 type I restriction-modification system S subunit [Saccharibacter floricola DSM 15669]
MLPEGWKLSNLGLIGKWAGGKTPSKANDSFWSNGTIPWVSPKDMITGKIFSTEDYITQVAIQENKNRLYPSGSIVVVTRSGILRKKLPVAIVEVPFTVNQDIKVLPDNKNIISEYIYNYIMCFEKIILKSCQKEGTTVESIDTDSFLSFPISLPPLPEQKKIAAILSTWDRAIEGTEKLLANSQQQKKSLMQQLLTAKKRLPGFVGEWERVKISDIANIRTSVSKAKYFSKDGERFIVDMGSVDRQGKLKCTKKTHHDGDVLEKGTLIMPKDDIGGGNIIGKTAIIAHNNLYVMSDHVYALHIHDCYSGFIHFLINSYEINKSLLRKANGTAQLGLGRKEVLKQEIRIPPSLPEQKAIAAVLTTADDEITAIKADLERLRREKKALMQQLLTGKRRVVVDAEVSA